MNNEQCNLEPAAQAKAPEPQRAYHHGDLRNGLLEAARGILEERSRPGPGSEAMTAGGCQPCRALSPFPQS